MPVGARGRRSEQEAPCTQHVKILKKAKRAGARPFIPPSLVSAGLRRDAPWSPPAPPKPRRLHACSHISPLGCVVSFPAWRGVAYLARTVSGRLIGAQEVE